MRLFIVLCAATLALCACGKKGPLITPPPKPAAAEPLPAPIVDEDDSEEASTASPAESN